MKVVENGKSIGRAPINIVVWLVGVGEGHYRASTGMILTGGFSSWLTRCSRTRT